MDSNKLSRRSLLGGLLAAFFGWRLPPKVAAVPAEPEVGATETSTDTVQPEDFGPVT